MRYLLTAQDSVTRYQAAGFAPLAQVRGITILRSRRAWPLGVVLRRYLPETDFARLDSARRQQVLTRPAVVPAALDTSAAIVDSVQWQPVTDDNHLAGRLRLRQPGLLFLAIPLDEGWTLHVNGQPVPLHLFYDGLQGAVLAPGQYTLQVDFQDPYRRRGGWLSLASLLALAGLAPWLGRHRATGSGNFGLSR